MLISAGSGLVPGFSAGKSKIRAQRLCLSKRSFLGGPGRQDPVFLLISTDREGGCLKGGNDLDSGDGSVHEVLANRVQAPEAVSDGWEFLFLFFCVY